ncbi:hypothetical protein GC163_22780 [bacterium]|nr:hypothetical protein [bacterium]
MCIAGNRTGGHRPLGLGMTRAVLTSPVQRTHPPLITGVHEECWSRLCYAVDELLPLVAVTGAAEVGKSTLLQHLASDSRARRTSPWLQIDVTGMSTAEFVQQLAQAIECPDASHPWDGVHDWLTGIAMARESSVWIIDHVNYATEDLGLALRRLLRLIEHTQAAITVMIATQQASTLANIADRVSLWCDVPVWDLEATTLYLQRSTNSEALPGGYSLEAMQAVQDCTSGIAGQVHRLSELCPLAASIRELTQIDVDLVLDVWRELVTPHA